VEALATRRVEALELPARIVRGKTHNPGIRPGRRITITDHARDDANAEFVVWKVNHQAAQHTYTNTFEAFPSDVPFRPARLTPAPRIHGCQTAMVVGKSGEEITTDQYGRIKVKFHWDQRSPADDTSSCWVRVAQVWAGKQWGALFLPRIGQEVVVAFLDGDPDRPLVTGSVYNATTTVPYALPANQTRSTIKSDSSKGGGGANEIRFEDKKGSEELFVQAQKDMVVSVLNNDALTVKGTRAVEVTGAETHTNKKGLAYTITDDLELTVGGKLTLKVTGDVQLQVTGNIAIESAKDVKVKAGIALNSEAVTIASKASATHNVEGGATVVIKGGIVKIN
jgi:type VI secretion system secreted protein VgrG